MSNHPVTQQPVSTDSKLRLLPDEYIRVEYNYKPGCCCFSSKIVTVTNMRLITRVIKTPICSRKTSTGEEKVSVMYLANINDIKQIQSIMPSNQKKWWMKYMDILTYTCSNEQDNCLESGGGGVENLAMDTTESEVESNKVQKTISVEKY
jgi:hypothetical protein